MDEHENQKESYSFLQETIKEEKVNRKKLRKYICIVAALGIVFGISTGAGFVMIKPWISALIQEEEPPIEIPQDDIAIDMDKTKEEVKEEVKEELKEEIKEETDSKDATTISSYEKIYDEFRAIANQVNTSLVTININGNHDETTYGKTGVVVADTEQEWLILCPIEVNDVEEKCDMKLANGQFVEGKLIGQDYNIGYGVYALKKSAQTKGVQVAKLGNSLLVEQGEFVIALGNQFSFNQGIGYGVVSSVTNTLQYVDGNYALIGTTLPMGDHATGVLSNVKGEIVGLINHRLSDGMVLQSIGISHMKPLIERLSNGRAIPYLGLKVEQITAETSQKEGIPIGFYILEVEPKSPAMKAGIKNGDILMKINDNILQAQNEYQIELQKYNVEDVINIKGKRLGNDEYVDFTYDIKVGAKK